MMVASIENPSNLGLIHNKGLDTVHIQCIRAPLLVKMKPRMILLSLPIKPVSLGHCSIEVPWFLERRSNARDANGRDHVGITHCGLRHQCHFPASRIVYFGDPPSSSDLLIIASKALECLEKVKRDRATESYITCTTSYLSLHFQQPLLSQESSIRSRGDHRQSSHTRSIPPRDPLWRFWWQWTGLFHVQRFVRPLPALEPHFSVYI